MEAQAKFHGNKRKGEKSMKRLKRIPSIVLAMVMVLGMSLTAFATGATPPTDETEDPV